MSVLLRERRWALSTGKLGDAICLYSVLKHTPEPPLVYAERFQSLFPDVPVSSKGSIWKASDAFMATNPDDHVIDRLAQAYQVPSEALQAPVWERPAHQGYVALCPHATVTQREWNRMAWLQVMGWLTQQGIPYRYLEAPRLGREALPFEDFKDAVIHARAVVGVDSGHVHLADAFGVPVVGLYGPIGSQHWGAYRFRHYAIDATKQTVGYTAHHRTHRRWPPPKLMDRITPEQVIAQLEAVLTIT